MGKYVCYFEAQCSGILVQAHCKNRDHYIEQLTFLHEKYPDLEIMFREWSDGTVEDGVIEK